jgi:sugar lactone lactonase YvrE
MPSPDGPNEITVGPDGALWFTELSAGAGGGTNGIGRITTSGSITEYPVPSATSLTGITAGPDGTLWFTETYGTAKIGRITTAGVVTEYAVPTAGAGPYEITVGPDGALWFTELYGGIGRITTDGVVSEYATLTSPTGITKGPDGALWFTEGSGNKLGRITTSGVVTEYPLPNANSYPYGITTGPDGELWFTEGANSVGQGIFVTASLNASPTKGPYRTSLNLTGSEFDPAESVEIYYGGLGSKVLASSTTDAAGSFTVSVTAPKSPYGPRLFLSKGQTSGKVAAATFFVTPKLLLTPNSGAVGSTVTVKVYGFGSFENVSVYWSNPHILLTTASTNVAGALETAITVPTAPPGRDKVLALGQTTGAVASASFSVQ